nr:ATP synthase F0 subunit 8 [Secretargas transgariepinus]QLD97092.1 ATP synthase F0 subunit 8 [Secretargas transgariepinus]
MPQLFPMNWIILSLYFTLNIYMLLMIFYFNQFFKKKWKKNNFLKLNKKWKW